jgi:hypothetical protein
MTAKKPMAIFELSYVLTRVLSKVDINSKFFLLYINCWMVYPAMNYKIKDLLKRTHYT